MPTPLVALLIPLAAAGPWADAPAARTAALECHTSASPASLATRASPLDSVSFEVGNALVKICYGRPSSRGRTMIGGHHVPYGKLWRTGANEPTMIHTTAPITVAGIALEAGTYSLYTLPGRTEWAVIVNRSIEQWGDEGSYDQVKDQEVGRAMATVSKVAEPIEQFTIRVESTRRAAHLILEWEHTRLTIPVTHRP